MRDNEIQLHKHSLSSDFFWRGKRVFLTGHTGFKGSWLSIWLHLQGAQVTGYSLPAPTVPSLFEMGHLEHILQESVMGDIADVDQLRKVMAEAKPEIVIHMAAQPLVRLSYLDPIMTYRTNVMGTVNVMEAARTCDSVRVIVNVTTDKVYENHEWHWGYREIDALGGYDPYSSSKACSELVTAAYRRSFMEAGGVQVATARAGNVIGGGDWAQDRLIPDLVRAFEKGELIELRHPESVRPWQHVLEPLSGYLLLCQKLYESSQQYTEAWNFGPRDHDVQSVQWIVERMLERWPNDHPGYRVVRQDDQHEATMLKLDCSKAINVLGWKPRWTLDTALDHIISWVMEYRSGRNARELCEEQIKEYEASSTRWP